MNQILRLLELALLSIVFVFTARLTLRLIDTEYRAGYAQGQLDIYTNWSEKDVAKTLKKW